MCFDAGSSRLTRKTRSSYPNGSFLKNLAKTTVSVENKGSKQELGGLLM